VEVSFRLCQASPGFSLMQTTSSSLLLLVFRSPAWGFLDSRSARQIIPSQGQKDSFSDGSSPLMAHRWPPLDRVSRLSGRTAEAAVASSLAATVGDLVLVLDLRMLLALQSPSRSQHGGVWRRQAPGCHQQTPCTTLATTCHRRAAKSCK